ncbi:MAG: hypothetical protein IJ892_10325 [Prevotella sp.]|jgi:hypothetical protein|nr:hypothetical protein [Prevotella sp.]
MMYIGADPVMTAVVVAGVFIYYAFKGSGKKKHSFKDKKSEKDFYKWLAEGFDRRNHDKAHSNMRWVEEHFKE